jgi:hypothetical protein
MRKIIVLAFVILSMAVLAGSALAEHGDIGGIGTASVTHTR